MVGTAISRRQARIALDADSEASALRQSLFARDTFRNGIALIVGDGVGRAGRAIH